MNISVEEYRARAARTMPESELQENVRQACKKLGHLYFHPWNSQHSPDGYPDCTILTRDGRLIFAELKRQNREPTDAQREWLEALELIGIEAYLWRPSDWLDGTIEDVLSGAQR